jgi:hypothetical protein
MSAELAIAKTSLESLPNQAAVFLIRLRIAALRKALCRKNMNSCNPLTLKIRPQIIRREVREAMSATLAIAKKCCLSPAGVSCISGADMPTEPSDNLKP